MHLYESKGWGRGSGEGSSIHFATKTICMLSGGTLRTMLGVTLFVDVPCGDQQWAPTLRALNPWLKYIGLDVMPGLVQWNREQYGDARTEFFLADMGVDKDLFASLRRRSKLWDVNSDVVAIHSRHVLQHLDYDSIFHYFDEVRASGARWFIGTNNGPFQRNPTAMQRAGYSQLNFYLPPFNFPQALFKWHEGGTLEMEVWRISDIPAASKMREELALMIKGEK